MLAQGCLALTAFSKLISVNKFLFGLVLTIWGSDPNDIPDNFCYSLDLFG